MVLALSAIDECCLRRGRSGLRMSSRFEGELETLGGSGGGDYLRACQVDLLVASHLVRSMRRAGSCPRHFLASKEMLVVKPGDWRGFEPEPRLAMLRGLENCWFLSCVKVISQVIETTDDANVKGCLGFSLGVMKRGKWLRFYGKTEFAEERAAYVSSLGFSGERRIRMRNGGNLKITVYCSHQCSGCESLASGTTGHTPIHLFHKLGGIIGADLALIKLEDNRLIETVGIPVEDSKGSSRLTAFVSSQVGYPMRCSFCVTGKGGYLRNLKRHEIVEQGDGDGYQRVEHNVGNGKVGHQGGMSQTAISA
ncbi:hypothetical protein IFM89_009620 [Coptis chinensis]|uniref:Uncharacterized protein n=1 Tax=Coptis chinensis TaxID=261450 RepID=A0A835MC95_9MAGN|nr:hypothetical protein IFM89_009620 [Coptis chinensis]